jgi:hypothetical protein
LLLLGLIFVTASLVGTLAHVLGHLVERTEELVLTVFVVRAVELRVGKRHQLLEQTLQFWLVNVCQIFSVVNDVLLGDHLGHGLQVELHGVESLRELALVLIVTVVATPAALVASKLAAALLVASSLVAAFLVVVPIVAFLVSIVMLLLSIIGLVALPLASASTALVVTPVAAWVTVGALLWASLVLLSFWLFTSEGRGGLSGLGSIGSVVVGAFCGVSLWLYCRFWSAYCCDCLPGIW